jgi:hypothetical protein
MKVVKKREGINAPCFEDLKVGDVFFSPRGDYPNEPYMKTDEGGFSDGYAVNLTSGLTEEFSDSDAIVKVEATLTIE